MSNKQSSVEWLHHEFERIEKEFHVGSYEYNYAKNLALKISKAMHKEETIKLYNDYQDYLDEEFKNQCGGQGNILTFEQYYNNTFEGGNK